MMIMNLKKTILTGLLTGLLAMAYAQNGPMFSWQSFLPYSESYTAAEAGEYVFIGTKTGLYRVAKEDLSIRRFAKEDGMADQFITALAYSSTAEALIIGYKNGNIDVYKDNTFSNYPDIINSNSVSDKEIYSITTYRNMAYICAGFGISSYDLNTFKFIGTVKFQPMNAPEIGVKDIFVDDDNMYAATEKGIYYYSDNNLFENFESWTPVPGLNTGSYTHVDEYNGKIHALYSGKLSLNADEKDTVFVLNGGGSISTLTEFYGKTLNGLNSGRNRLCITIAPTSGNSGSVMVKDADGSTYINVSNNFFVNPRTPIVTNDNRVWVPDAYFSLLVCSAPNEFRLIYPQGPFTNKSRRIDVYEGKLAVASGSLNNGFGPVLNSDGVFFYDGTDWKYQNGSNQPLMQNTYDYNDIIRHPTDPTVYYASAIYQGGLFRFKDNVCTNVYNNATTGGILGDTNSTSIHALAFDSQGNLLMANAGTSKALAIMKPDGSFSTVSIPGINSSDRVVKIIPVTDEILWMAVYNKGIVAIKHTDYAISNIRLLTNAIGSGKLPSLQVTSMARDKDGEIWVGTGDGFTIFYNPSSVFESGVNIDASQPVVKADDGNNEPVLKGANVYSIAVDGGNRKWISMVGSGATLLSDDGFTILESFTKSNSPLLSDIVYSADIDGVSGDVYFSTDIGICAYRSDATEAEDQFSDVYAFPNPVRPGYSGYVTIKNLAQDAEVKITDVNGQLIYETVANGGTAVWNMESFSGHRAKSGIYLVFANGAEKKVKHVAKILVMQ